MFIDFTSSSPRSLPAVQRPSPGRSASSEHGRGANKLRALTHDIISAFAETPDYSPEGFPAVNITGLSKKLDIPKRRFYDVTNPLTALGLVMRSRGVIYWTGFSLAHFPFLPRTARNVAAPRPVSDTRRVGRLLIRAPTPALDAPGMDAPAVDELRKRVAALRREVHALQADADAMRNSEEEAPGATLPYHAVESATIDMILDGPPQLSDQFFEQVSPRRGTGRLKDSGIVAAIPARPLRPTVIAVSTRKGATLQVAHAPGTHEAHFRADAPMSIELIAVETAAPTASPALRATEITTEELPTPGAYRSPAAVAGANALAGLSSLSRRTHPTPVASQGSELPRKSKMRLYSPGVVDLSSDEDSRPLSHEAPFSPFSLVPEIGNGQMSSFEFESSLLQMSGIDIGSLDEIPGLKSLSDPWPAKGAP